MLASATAARADGLPVCTASGDQLGIALCRDGRGGMFLAWDDRRGADSDVYAHRLDAAGAPHSSWPSNGVPVCTLVGDQRDVRIATDGAGGAFVAWQDRRNGAIDIYLQRITAEGGVAIGWPAGGALACGAPGVQSDLVLAADGTGGVFLAWTDYRVQLDGDVYALHLNALGHRLSGWPADGRRVCNASGTQRLPAMIAGDGGHHALIAWEDDRDGAFGAYAQRVADSGHSASVWPMNGVRLGLAPGDQTALAIATDGAGGAFVVWEDRRNANVDLYLQRVSAAGEFVRPWRVEGHALCVVSGSQLAPRLVADGAGGVISVWFDARAGAQFDVYAHRFDASGAPVAGWSFGGNPLCTASGNQVYPAAIADGAGGVLAAWGDGRGAAFDAYAARITGNGRRGSCWPGDGLSLSDAGGDQANVVLATDGTGCAVFAWEDHRTGGTDVYAARVDLATVDADAWPSDPVVVSGADGDQFASLSRGRATTSDGAGGAFFAWVDARDAGNDIYVQRLSSAGAVTSGWNAGGNAACTAPGLQDAPLLVRDGTDGVYALWSDGRGGETQRDIYAQRLTGGGTVAAGWNLQGVAVCSAGDAQHSIAAIPDGAGGFFAFWQDRRDGATAKLFGIRMNAAATIAAGWQNDGRALCAAPGDQAAPGAALTASGNAFVVWQDRRNGLDFDLRGLGITPAGGLVTGWDADGNAVVVGAGDDIEPRIAADDTGGGFVLWKRVLGTASQLRLQRLLMNGQRAAGWPADGILIEGQSSFEHDLAADATGGAHVVWGAVRGGRARLFVQRVAPGGGLQWTPGGVPVDAGGGSQMSAAFAPDAAGGVLVAWMDVESAVTIRTQHIEASGARAAGWSGVGHALQGAMHHHPNGPALVTDGDGCSIVSWFDVRPGTGLDLFAARLHPDRSFTVDAVAPREAQLTAWPNPFVNATRVRFVFPTAATYSVDVFDARGRRVRRLMQEARTAGSWDIGWDGRRDDGTTAASGVYWLQARGTGFTARCKLVRER